MTAVVGRFTGGAGEQVVALGRDGALLMASGVKRGTSTYTRSDRVGTVSPSAIPSSITRGFSTDVNHDGRLDVLFPRGDGELLLLLNQPGDEGRPGFVASLARARRPTRWSWESASSARTRATGSSGSTRGGTSSRPRSRSAVATSRWGRPNVCSKLVPARAPRGRSIPWSFHRRHHRRPPAPAWGRSHVTHRARHAPRCARVEARTLVVRR